MNSRTFRSALVAALGLVVIAGCGPESSDGGTVDGPTLYLSEQGDPKSIDPHIAGDVVSSRMCGMTYECLYQYGYLARPAKLIP
jgi:ABC-type oligopeptide transport system substrate-binding subunit